MAYTRTIFCKYDDNNTYFKNELDLCPDDIRVFDYKNTTCVLKKKGYNTYLATLAETEDINYGDLMLTVVTPTEDDANIMIERLRERIGFTEVNNEYTASASARTNEFMEEKIRLAEKYKREIRAPLN